MHQEELPSLHQHAASGKVFSLLNNSGLATYVEARASIILQLPLICINYYYYYYYYYY